MFAPGDVGNRPKQYDPLSVSKEMSFFDLEKMLDRKAKI
jgi:hypothetical protein